MPHHYEVNAHAEHEPASVRAHAFLNNLPLQVIIFAFSSYMLADSFGLSGIVSILFCGLVRCPPALAFKRRTLSLTCVLSGVSSMSIIMPQYCVQHQDCLCLRQVSAHYVRPNISRNARDRTAAFFKVRFWT